MAKELEEADRKRLTDEILGIIEGAFQTAQDVRAISGKLADRLLGMAQPIRSASTGALMNGQPAGPHPGEMEKIAERLRALDHTLMLARENVERLDRI